MTTFLAPVVAAWQTAEPFDVGVMTGGLVAVLCLLGYAAFEWVQVKRQERARRESFEEGWTTSECGLSSVDRKDAA